MTRAALPPVTVRDVRVPRWEDKDGHVWVWQEEAGTWQKLAPWTRGILEGLEAGASTEALLAHAETHHGRNGDVRLRRFLFTLMSQGHLRLSTDEPEPAYPKRYERIEELGRGGVGIVDLARDTADGAHVTIKRPWQLLGSLEAIGRLVAREAELLGRLDHPTVVPLRDRFEAQSRTHLVRGYVEGRELMVYRYRGVPDEAALVRLVGSVLDAVGHLHARGLLLLDISPGNFLETPDGRAVLLDVGHAKEHEGGRARVRGAAKPRFDAPERRTGEVSIRSDLYGVGRLAYFLGTGELPMPGWTTEELLARTREPRVVRLVASLAAMDPAERPSSVDEARALLV